MKFIKIILTILSVPILLTVGDLKFVTIVYRHGDRMPTQQCPMIDFGSDQDFGTLLNSGKLRAYEFGEYLREEYGDFLTPHYTENEIYVKSSDLSRTLMTAYCVQSALFKPKGKDLWLPSLSWQPVPVHSVPQDMDNLMYFTGVNCPKYNQHLDQQVSTDYIKNESSQYVETVREIAQQYLDRTLPEGIIPTLGFGQLLQDCLTVAVEKNMTLPDWAELYYPKRLQDSSAFFFSLFYSDTTLKRLHCGPLLKDIIANLEKKIGAEEDFDKLKMYQYSAHDTTITGLLNCLNVQDEEMVPYLGAVMIELHEFGAGDYKVGFKYRKEVADGFEVKTLVIPGCAELCPFEDFKILVNDVLPGDWSEECNEV